RKNDTALHLLEVGYGTGLNALLTMIHATATVYYTAIEPFPIPEEELFTVRELQSLGQPITTSSALLPWTAQALQLLLHSIKSSNIFS
ncbi:MAG: hypothetical protein RLZZ370_1741, partial [Bacteroidota bacterium]